VRSRTRSEGYVNAAGAPLGARAAPPKFANCLETIACDRAEAAKQDLFWMQSASHPVFYGCLVLLLLQGSDHLCHSCAWIFVVLRLHARF